MEKYITFSVPLKKEIKDNKLVTYKLRFIDSSRFMNASLASLVDNLSEINNKDCNKCMERNKIKSECKYIGFENNRLIYKCKKCDDISTKPTNELISFLPHINFPTKIPKKKRCLSLRVYG